MRSASLRRRIQRIEAEAAASKRERPEDKIAEFERAFKAIHVLVKDPKKDPGGAPGIPDDITLPTPAWTPAKLGPDQYAYVFSKARRNVADSGRRSFKTEGMIRRTIRAFITCNDPSARFFLCGPTFDQSKDRFWEQGKALVPTWALAGQNRDRAISDGRLTIRGWAGQTLRITGLDKPARIESGNWDGGGITEFGNCKPGILENHIEPMMVRGGWIDIEGTPELGATHYKNLSDQAKNGKLPSGVRHHWRTDDVLHLWLGRKKAEAQILDWQDRLDPRSYRQEIGGEWVPPSGRAYYAFEREVHAVRRLRYNPNLPLVVCFDFNVAPGVAAYVQELLVEGAWRTCVIGEVWISTDSNSRKVAQQVVRDWKSIHRGEVHLYGDASGGSGGSAQVDGSDWELIRAELDPWLGDRLKMYVPAANPAVKARINAVNARLIKASGEVEMFVDPISAPRMIEDLEGVVTKDDGSLEKPKESPLTHISDALGYYVERRFPVDEGDAVVEQAI